MGMKNIFLFVMIAFLSSCIFLHYDDRLDLGNHYYFIPDGKNSSIIKSNTKTYEHKGAEIIPPNVVKYQYDKVYIIAKSIELSNLTEHYWIVNKERKDIDGPLDSTRFYQMLKERKIDLKF